VRSQIVDRLSAVYVVREPLEPAELGHVYRLFYRAGFPKSISEQDLIFVAEDGAGEIVGGVCYKMEEPTVAHLDGIVVTGVLRGRGITTALLEDFCLRLASQGVRVIKTHYFLRQFYLRHGFQVDPRWGGLVRFLGA
jgi:GNAT superfamily N-acetyltransferase